MAGASLTLFWLDDELARLWETPVDTPAYRRGAVAAAEPRPAETTNASAPVEASAAPADDRSRAAAAVVAAVLHAASATIDDSVDELGHMDAIAGDGDHGIGMQRGVHAAVDAAEIAVAAGAGAGTVLSRAADAWAGRAGGTSGALWGVILSSIANRLGDEGVPAATSVGAGVADAVRAVQQYGKAEVGDKTLVDALVPSSAALVDGVEGGASLDAAWEVAAVAATEAAAATSDLLPRLGRARTHGAHSLGTPDPGAHSLALIATAVAAVLTPKEGNANA